MNPEAKTETPAMSEDMAGLRDLRDLTHSVGLPATRATLRFAIRAANLRGAAKAAALRDISAISPVKDIGCMRVDFFNASTGRADAAYLVLDRCPRLHDLGAQLGKLRPHVSDEKWPEVVRSLSSLVHIGRCIYGQTVRKHLDLLRRIRRAPPDDPCTDYLDLQVDPTNTTLYLDASWPERIGLYVRLGAETTETTAATAARV